MMNHLIDDSVDVNCDLPDVSFFLAGRSTLAVLTREGTILARGVAIRKPGDPDCKSVGKAFALGRALIQLGQHYLDLANVLDVANTIDQA